MLTLDLHSMGTCMFHGYAPRPEWTPGVVNFAAETGADANGRIGLMLMPSMAMRSTVSFIIAEWVYTRKKEATP